MNIILVFLIPALDIVYNIIIIFQFIIGKTVTHSTSNSNEIT